jgi:hypothetical protein
MEKNDVTSRVTADSFRGQHRSIAKSAGMSAASLAPVGLASRGALAVGGPV